MQKEIEIRREKERNRDKKERKRDRKERDRQKQRNRRDKQKEIVRYQSEKERNRDTGTRQKGIYRYREIGERNRKKQRDRAILFFTLMKKKSLIKIMYFNMKNIHYKWDGIIYAEKQGISVFYQL